MKQKTGILAITVLIALGIIWGDKMIPREQIIVINEVRCWDKTSLDEGYNGSGYIELYNCSNQDVSLDGWYISNDASKLKKNKLYDVTIGAGQTALLYANKRGDSGYSLNFKLNTQGEKLFLSDEDGNLIDSVLVPQQEFGTVYARETDGAANWCVQTETTDYSNNEAKVLPQKCLKKPFFSYESGFYEKEFYLELKADAGQEIYYTLDGSEPTKDAILYKEPILIKNVSGQPNVCNAVQNVVEKWKDYTPTEELVDKAVVVRAITVNEKNQISDVCTNTYFVGEKEYENETVLSIVADYVELFGEQGIFVTGKDYDDYYLSDSGNGFPLPNYEQRGKEWEICGNIQLFENGKETANQQVGIRTQGAGTRKQAKKRMSLFAREEYSGSKYFDRVSFEDRETHSVLVNTSISNAILPALVKDRNIAVADAYKEEICVFLNGEYWYNAWIIEKYNRYYLEEQYGVDRNNVAIIKNHEASEGGEKASELYRELNNCIANGELSVEEKRNRLEQMIDMQSYIDYICANTYLCNMDMADYKNCMLWRTIEADETEVGDGRWRWMMYDTDCIDWTNPGYYEVNTKAEINSFNKKMQTTGYAIKEQPVFIFIKRSEELRQQFVVSFLDMANVNFSMENVTKVFEDWNRSPEIYGDFFEKRFDYIVPYMAEEFDLTGTLEKVTLKVNNSNGGTIRLNTTTPDLSKGSWTGRYYTDYPVTVTAVPEEGYEFVGWSGSVTSDSATIEAEVTTGGITLEAVFEKTEN